MGVKLIAAFLYIILYITYLFSYKNVIYIFHAFVYFYEDQKSRIKLLNNKVNYNLRLYYKRINKILHIYNSNKTYQLVISMKFTEHFRF